MIPIGTATRIFLALGPTDLRKGFDGLVDRVRHHLQEDPLSGHLFIFCNQPRNRLKLLYWDGSGLWLCSKRLEKGCFSWPSCHPESGPKKTLSAESLALLLGGIELERTRQKNWWRRAA
jgi:transposase